MKKQLLLILCLGCSLSFSTVYAQNNNGGNQPAAQTGQQAAAKADTPKPAKSHLHLTKNSIDFGTIHIGKTKVVEVTFTNTGSKPLIITDTYTNCNTGTHSYTYTGRDSCGDRYPFTRCESCSNSYTFPRSKPYGYFYSGACNL